MAISMLVVRGAARSANSGTQLQGACFLAQSGLCRRARRVVPGMRTGAT
jgi:hypothetical protein